MIGWVGRGALEFASIYSCIVMQEFNIFSCFSPTCLAISGLCWMGSTTCFHLNFIICHNYHHYSYNHSVWCVGMFSNWKAFSFSHRRIIYFWFCLVNLSHNNLNICLYFKGHGRNLESVWPPPNFRWGGSCHTQVGIVHTQIYSPVLQKSSKYSLGILGNWRDTTRWVHIAPRWTELRSAVCLPHLTLKGNKKVWFGAVYKQTTHIKDALVL